VNIALYSYKITSIAMFANKKSYSKTSFTLDYGQHLNLFEIIFNQSKNIVTMQSYAREIKPFKSLCADICSLINLAEMNA